jgi:CO/xanthine dehydrogenase FAD-binding subunit
MTEVFLPRTMSHLWELIEKYPEAGFYAGGTDFLVKVRESVCRPDKIICLERIDGLKGISDLGPEIVIGAATTHSQILAHEVVAKNFPLLIKAIKVLASPPIRNMGTIGGNIVTASPAGDTLPALYVLAADIETVFASGERVIPIEQFISGPGKTGLEAGEILWAIHLRKSGIWNVSHYEKVGIRRAQACALASLAAVLRISSDNVIENASLAWGAVAPTVVKSAKVEEILVGRQLTLDTLKHAAAIVYQLVSPIDDIRARAQYRRSVAASLMLRLLSYSNTNINRSY